MLSCTQAVPSSKRAWRLPFIVDQGACGTQANPSLEAHGHRAGAGMATARAIL